MARYLLDTGFAVLALTDNLPEKWTRPWSEIRKGLKDGLVIEPVIAEIYFQLLRKGVDREKARALIIKMKGLVQVMNIDDETAISAGHNRIRFGELSLSLVDCLLLAVGSKYKTKIYTTDERLKIASRRMNIPCDCLPVRV